MSVTTAKLLKAPAKRAARGMLEGLLDRALDHRDGLLQRAIEQRESLAQRALAHRPPVQVAVDVAVPLEVAWDEWMSFDAFTEGTWRIEGIRRQGRKLTGRTSRGAGAHTDWKAEVVDERRHEAFAWRSLEGTDCAGLVTFHRLSDRLTRIELDLDVLPTGPLEAAVLLTGLAGRRASTELRRFKARVEFINPDVYETDRQPDGEHGSSTEDEPNGS